MNKYEKLAMIGRGAHGTVYLCERIDADNVGSGQNVIIKEIPVEGMSKAQRQNALGEANVLKRLSHPNIIGYYEYFIDDATNSLCIVMQYAEGGTLHEFLQQRKGRPLEEEKILQFFTQILLALHHVHSKLIVHRDLKTENILLNRSRTLCKLSDFGISKELMTQSKATTVVGTPHYLSPEVCMGRAYNQKSDIWALGCILYELATLRRAFQADTMPGLFDKIVRNSPAPMGDHVSTELNQLVNSCLDRDPSRRPDTCQLLSHPLLLSSVLKLITDLGTLPCPRPMKEPTTPTSNKKLKTRADARMTSTSFSPQSVNSNNGQYHVILKTADHNATVELKIPDEHTEISQVVTSGRTHFAVTEGGALYCWETRTNKLSTAADDTATSNSSPESPRPPNVSTPNFLFNYIRSPNVVTVAAGDGFYVLVNDQGMLLSAGVSEYGCLGLGSETLAASQPRVVESLMTTAVTRIACGPTHVLALTDDHRLYAWGRNANGRLGVDSSKAVIDTPQPVQLDAKAQIHSIYCSLDASAVVLVDGLVWATGSNRYNKLALSTNEHSVTETRQFRRTNLPSIDLQQPQPFAVGPNHTAVISEQHVYVIGYRSGRRVSAEYENVKFNISDSSSASDASSNTALYDCAHMLHLEHRPRRLVAGHDCTHVFTADHRVYKHQPNKPISQVELPFDHELKKDVISVDMCDHALICAVKY